MTISQKGFEKHKKDAIELDKSNSGDEYDGDGANYGDMEMADTDYEFDASNGQLAIFGPVFKSGTEMAWLDIRTEVSIDLALDMVNYYMKKLGKLKTVLEATK